MVKSALSVAPQLCSLPRSRISVRYHVALRTTESCLKRVTFREGLCGHRQRTVSARQSRRFLTFNTQQDAESPRGDHPDLVRDEQLAAALADQHGDDDLVCQLGELVRLATFNHPVHSVPLTLTLNLTRNPDP